MVLLIKKQLEDDDYYRGSHAHAPAKSPRIDVDDLAEAAPSLPYAARPNFNPVNRPVYFKAMVLWAAHRLEAEGWKITVAVRFATRGAQKALHLATPRAERATIAAKKRQK